MRGKRLSSHRDWETRATLLDDCISKGWLPGPWEKHFWVIGNGAQTDREKTYRCKFTKVNTWREVSSVQSLSHVWLFVTPWTATCQATLSIINSWSMLKLMSIESVMPSNHLILCHPLLLLPSVFPSIRVFSNESALHIRWPKYWSLSFSISPSNEYSGLISFRRDWLDLLDTKIQGSVVRFGLEQRVNSFSIELSVMAFIYLFGSARSLL